MFGGRALFSVTQFILIDLKGFRWKPICGDRVENSDSLNRSPCDARRRERPRHCAAEQGDELPPLHSITSSARTSEGGTVRPSASAVLRLMINSNFVGCSTGRSAGFAPCSILWTYVAARRKRSGILVPYDMSPPNAIISSRTP